MRMRPALVCVGVCGIRFVIFFCEALTEETQIPLKLNEGWNLISLPATPCNTDAETIFNGVITDRIWTFHGERLKVVTSIEPGVGYWVFSRRDISLNIATVRMAERRISLAPGRWHLVAALKKDPVLSSIIAPVIWGWNRDHFEVLTPNNSLTPTTGYFFYGTKKGWASLKLDNIAPVANAGPDHIALVSSSVTLDGTSSTDANGDTLAFQWSLSSAPQGSSTILYDSDTVNPTFLLDLPGTYTVQLVVDDGITTSEPDTTTVSIDDGQQVVIDLKYVRANLGVLTRIHGSTGDGRFGVPVAGGVDCNGDDFLDTAFAAIKANPLKREGAGEVTLIFGNGTIGGTVDTAGFSKDILKIAGAQMFEVAGAEIWMDDVTGDGLGDLLICRQNHTPALGREGAGSFSIIVGDRALKTYAETEKYLDLSMPPDEITVLTFVGDKAYDRLGIWVRTGDITGDNISDIVVGADEVDGRNGKEKNSGAAYIVRGGSHLAFSGIIDLAQFGTTDLAGHVARIDPPPNSENFHFGSTCQIADLDGNGCGEILISAALNRAGAAIRLPGAPSGTGQGTGGANRGKLFIAWDDNFCLPSWPPGYNFEISSPPEPEARTIIQGASFNRAFGEEILGGLDYNGDGLPDLFVGDLVADGGNGTQSGVGYVFFNAFNLRDQVFDMNSPPENVEFSLIKGPSAGAIGADTATHGDFNHDGIADLVIGNPHDNPIGRSNAGTMHVLSGKVDDWPDVIDLADGKLPSPESMRIIRINGAHGNAESDTGDVLCYSAAAADLDRDGYTDIIVNEMAGNGLAPNSVDVGNLLLISGAALFDSSKK